MAALIVSVLGFLPEAAAQEPLPVPSMDEAKIDPPLLEALRTGEPARAIIVGRTQLFPLIGGLEEFQRDHDTEDRLALRQRVVEGLKENGRDEQARILRAIGRTEADQALWILNALSLELSPHEVRLASQLEEVLYIYSGGEKLQSRERQPDPILILPNTISTPFSSSG